MKKIILVYKNKLFGDLLKRKSCRWDKIRISLLNFTYFL